MTDTVRLEHTADEVLERFELIAGAGSPDDNTACVMTAVAWMAGESWTDSPQCAHRLLRHWAIAANDDNDTTPPMRAELVRAGEQGLVDTWWVPDTVVLGCMALAEGEDHYAKTLGTLRLIEWWKGAKTRADLSGADLTRAYLSRADITRAYLSGANLSGANLYGANLTGADLYRADLSRADLSRADLYGANLSRANLYGANLSRANLTGADLTGAYLSGAYLSGANLTGANLYGANLSRANLTGADLSGADLTGADLSVVRCLRDAYWNGDTIWPDGFDPKAAS